MHKSEAAVPQIFFSSKTGEFKNYLLNYLFLNKSDISLSIVTQNLGNKRYECGLGHAT